jgi:hypothetical protein
MDGMMVADELRGDDAWAQRARLFLLLLWRYWRRWLTYAADLTPRLSPPHQRRSPYARGGWTWRLPVPHHAFPLSCCLLM